MGKKGEGANNDDVNQPGAENEEVIDNDQNQPGADDDGGEGGEPKGPQTLEEAQALIKSLRKEAGDRRTENKSLKDKLTGYDNQFKQIKGHLGIKDEEEDTPENRIAALTQNNDQLQMDLSIMQLARENGIAPEDDKYFRFLLAEKFEGLGEDEELSEEALTEVLTQVQAVSKKKPASSTGQGGGKKPNGEQDKGAVTVEQFAKMSLSQRTEIYDKNPTLYSELMSKARSSRLI